MKQRPFEAGHPIFDAVKSILDHPMVRGKNFRLHSITFADHDPTLSDCHNDCTTTIDPTTHLPVMICTPVCTKNG